ncbi:MAG: hypothetical protein IJX13_06695 [Clostridia bacterium]|nr:hypothetical protein [Clostridia bacterium]
MKIRNTSRIIAFALALVMIVPLISVPTFAADATAQNAAASTLYSQDFEKQGLETSDVTVDKINGTSIVEAADTKHGNVYQLSSKIPEELKNVYYLYVDGKYTKLEDVAPDADGKITVTQGEQTIVGVVNTDGFSTKAEIDGATATNNTYIVNGQMYAAREGMNPIVTPNYLATPDYKTDRLAFSVDYYFGAGYGAESDMRLSGDNGKAIDLLSFVPNTTNGTVTIRVHSGACNTSGNSGYIVYPYNDGYQLHGAWTTGAKTINANTWVNVKIIVDFTTGSFAIYLDDVLWQIRQEYTWRTNAYTSTGMKGNSWNFIQINRGKNPSVYNAENSYIQVDNIAIYDDAEISKLGLFNGLNENFESYTFGNNYDSTGYYANSAAGYTIQNGTASNTSKVWDIGNASGSYDKGWTINHEILSSVVTPELVFEADYFIGKNSTGVELTSEFVLSFYNVDGSAAVSRTAFMSPFTISYGANATTATLKANAQNSVTNSSTVLPVDEWFTLSVAVNMRTGYFEIYVNGDLAQSARLYRGGYATGFTVMPGSWSAGKHKVSGGYSGELQIDNMKIYEGSVPTNYVANAYAEDYTGDTTVTGTNAVIENDTAKIVNHYNDAVKAQNPGYVYGADNKVVLSAKYNINNLSNQASHLTSQFGGSYRTADGTLKSSSYIGLYMIWCDANENTTYTNGYARLQISGSNATYYIKE